MYQPIDLLASPRTTSANAKMPWWVTHPCTDYPVKYPELQHQLVTKDNYAEIVCSLVNQIANHQPLVGFDIETQDSERHDGHNQFMNIDPKSTAYKNPKKLVFDLGATKVTGFSIYVDQDQTCYYFNTGHADVENRIALEDVLPLMHFIRDNTHWVIHNATYEIACLMASWGFDIGKNYLCTLTMAVAAYNQDEYSITRMKANGLGGITRLLPQFRKLFMMYKERDELTGAQQDLLNSVLGKASDASHSYNGLVKESRWGYGLKEAVYSWFGHKMDTFKDTLNGKAHMGLLTSQEACRYGADDAYWCVRLFYALYDFMMATNPKVFNTFMQQENPMPRIFAKAWVRGCPVNEINIKKREQVERQNYAQTLRELQSALNALLPFDEEPKWRLSYRESKWYHGGKAKDAYKNYRAKVQKFASAEYLDDESIIMAVGGAVSEKLYQERGKKRPSTNPNFQHYMMQRTVLHDLCDLPFIFIKGDLKTDAEARGKLKDKVVEISEDTEAYLHEFVRYIERTQERKVTEDEREGLLNAAPPMMQWFKDHRNDILDVIKALDGLTTIEQRIKLFLNPYQMLMNPDTKRVHPLIRSELNTRRMSCENPNGMQLSKRGESTYIRGFYLPHQDDHLIVSVDWTQVELVLNGDASGDPGFYEAYGQIPYNDLHKAAAASAIAVKLDGFTTEDYALLAAKDPEAALKARFGADTDVSYPLINPITKAILDKPFKFWRGSAGKPSNFGYWYSGSLMTVQDKLGWTNDEMWRATENYRETFPVSEEWRKEVIASAAQVGYVELPDGLRRTRYESTPDWFIWFVGEWAKHGLQEVGRHMAKRIQRRAGNQVVNARIQGSCSTLAKRSLIAIDNTLQEEGGEFDAHLYMTIHDELVYSAHQNQAVAFGNHMKTIMCNHTDIVTRLKLDGTVSIGCTLEPYDAKKAPYGQIELDEAPELLGYLPPETKDQRLTDEQRQRVVDYLIEKPIEEDESWYQKVS